jgi:ParB-like chromosome segregation protein Spo0J
MTLVPFPDLRIVPLERCVLHEQTDDDRVARLVVRIEEEGTLRNPPILGRHPTIDTLIVLDGATRVTALQSLGAPHILAQVVDYDDAEIELHTWSHVLSEITLDELEMALADEALIREQRCDPQAAEAALQRRETLAYLADRDGRCVALGTSVDIVDQAAALRRLFAAYTGRAKIVRVAPTEWRARLQAGAAEAAVVFPVHTKDDLVALAQNEAVLPAGITRHIIPGRALRVNAPLSLLRNPQPLAEKQAWLDIWLHERRAERGVRYYAEPTFLFDE